MVDKIQSYIHAILLGYDNDIEFTNQCIATDEKLESMFKERGYNLMSQADEHRGTLDTLYSKKQQFIQLTTQNPLDAVILHADVLLPLNLQVKADVKAMFMDN